MQVCIIGLPKSGKTTIFNALTKGKIETATVSSSSIIPHIGVVKVPECRLDVLKSLFKPSKTVPAEIKYVDIAGIAKSQKKGEGIYGPYLNYLSNTDALIHVVRIFEDSNIPHIYGNIDPKRDIENMDLELIFSDLSIIEKRLHHIDTNLKGAKSIERENLIKEQTLLNRIRQQLENDIPIWKQELNDEEKKLISNYQFLTAKPLLIILNIGEKQLDKAKLLEEEIGSIFSFGKINVISICGKLEMELAQLSDNDAIEFRKSLGLERSAMESIISSSYILLELISFFTTVSSELKVWPVKKGTTAVKAAGKIHSDIEKGFIKAEVISFNDLQKFGNLAEVKKHGLLRLEGKNYVIQDGDIITFLFNV